MLYENKIKRKSKTINERTTYEGLHPKEEEKKR